jgi:hypothetical protein
MSFMFSNQLNALEPAIESRLGNGGVSEASALGSDVMDNAIFESLLVKLKRIYKLSIRPATPGFAYQHLEHIQALSASMLEALGVTEELSTVSKLTVPIADKVVINPMDVKPYGQRYMESAYLPDGCSPPSP